MSRFRLPALGVLGSGLLAAVGFVWSLALDVHTLKMESAEARTERNRLTQQMDEVHWFLIRRKGVQLPDHAKLKPAQPREKASQQPTIRKAD